MKCKQNFIWKSGIWEEMLHICICWYYNYIIKKIGLNWNWMQIYVMWSSYCSLLMLSCSYHSHALLTVVHIGDCENDRKIPFNSPCTRWCTCTHTHRCKHSSVLSLNDQSRGTPRGQSLEEGRPHSSQHLWAEQHACVGLNCVSSRWLLVKPQCRPAWRCGLEPLGSETLLSTFPEL